MDELKKENAKVIPITDIEGIQIGQVENVEASTGCTAFLCPDGMRAGLDVRGGGPASRESQLLNPLMAAQAIHGIVLSGGSAFGLDTPGLYVRFTRLMTATVSTQSLSATWPPIRMLSASWLRKSSVKQSSALSSARTAPTDIRRRRNWG